MSPVRRSRLQRAACRLLRAAPAWLLVAALGAAEIDAARAAEAQATPVAGTPFAGALARVDAQWRIDFTTSAGPRQLAAADLALWGAFVDSTRGTEILLIGGALLAADVKSLDNETLNCDGETVGAVKLPLETVAGILWHPPLDRAEHDRLARRVRRASGNADQLILDNGDVLDGSITAASEDAVKIDTAAGPVRVDVARAAAAVFNPSLAAQPPSSGLRAMVGLADGSRLLATNLKLGGEAAEIEAVGPGAVKLRVDRIKALQPFGGRAVYLSDLKAASYKHVPYLQLAWPYESDASVLGGSLRCGGKLFLKGLGLHSAARITYDLDQPYRFLQAELGIDDVTENRGSVEFRIFVDSGSGQWQPRYASPIVRGGQQPVAMSVDLAGVKRISVLVEFADRGDERDEADLLNARLIK